MSTSFSLPFVVRRGIVAAVVAGAGFAVAGAQTVAGIAQPAAQGLSAQPINFFNTAALPSSPSGLEATGSSSSSSSALGSSSSSLSSSKADSYNPEDAAQTQMASLGKVFEMPGAHAMQYGQRRRYGAPRYRGGNTNADGSEKYTGYVGGGFNSPIGTNSNYLTTSWGFQGGVGRNFNRHLGLNIEFDYDHFGLTGDAINQQVFRYDPTNQFGYSGYLDGSNHIWSVNFQPVYQIYSGQGLGAYITGGVGFYHKVTNFTLPQQQEYCSYYYGCGVYTVNGVIDHYTSNAPGFDGGIGVTYKFSRFANQRFYAEARYVYVDNSFKPGITNDTVNTYPGFNYFPENSQTTSYFPIKFGLRF